MSSVLAQLLVKIGADASEFTKAIEGASVKMEKVGKRLREIGGTLTTSVTAPLVGIGGAAINASLDLNKAMADVASLMPGATERVQELKRSVQDVAVATGQSSGVIAKGLYDLISAFGDSADTAKILDINARAAAGGQAQLRDAIALTSAVTKGYGDTSVGAVQRASDLAAMTVRLGQTTFPELAASIGQVTPLAGGLGVSMTELFGVMATATGVTGRAAEVSTQLRGVLQSLMAPTDSMSALMQSLGYQTGAAMIQGLGLQGTIDVIAGAANASGQPLQSYISSIEGQTLALALAGESSTALTEKIRAMEGAVGTADAAFLAQTTGVNAGGFAWAQFRERLAETSQQLGDALIPARATST